MTDITGMETITSASNQRVKQAAALRDADTRRGTGRAQGDRILA